MGANQSSGVGGSSDGGSGGRAAQVADDVKKCYYELLDVDQQATEDEIKKAYRRKALELHPDRNYGRVEETTKQFAEVQSAYEILSDPQERAWYDTHRDATLRGGDEASGDHYEHNVRITTADDIMRLFARFHGKLDFSDSPAGFYGTLRETFENLAREEELACEWEGIEPIAYPSFGHATDSHDGVVKTFYAIWNGFATKKSFSWADVYRYPEAPDRRVRRLMEKENKRLREEGIREFNDAVRSLVAFVRKRDPRFKPNVQTEAERQKVLQDAARAQAARSRAANQARSAQPQAIPEWMKSSEQQEESFSGEAEEKIQEHFECVVCKKNFKSEKQYETHEKSKKHVKAVYQLRRQMQQEDDSLSPGEMNRNQDASPSKMTRNEQAANSPSVPEEPNYVQETTSNVGDDNIVSSEEDSKEDRSGIQSGSDEAGSDLEPPTSSSDDEYTTRENVENRILGTSSTNTTDRTDTINSPQDSRTEIDGLSEGLDLHSLSESVDSTPQPKLGKAKEKRAKKAAQNASPHIGSEGEFKCVSCQAGFPSKTRLFSHIKDFGHAQPVQKPVKGGKGKKR